MNFELQQLLGCGIISSLMQEYATSSKSSDIGMSMELHLNAKKQFEAADIKRLFKLCIGTLSQLTKDNIPESTLPLFKQLLAIVESVLMWCFTRSNYILFHKN